MTEQTGVPASGSGTDNPASRKLRAAALCIALALAGCSDPQGAKDAAEAQGFTDVQPGGHSFWGCGQDDTTATEFTARGANGRCVTGVVCSAWLKGSTVRITGTHACTGKVP